MSESPAAYEEVGDPILGRVIQVPTRHKTAWLRKLNERYGISASPAGRVWSGEKGVRTSDVTNILVAKTVDYDRMGSQRSQQPYNVMRSIDSVIRQVARDFS